jgi:hypothetical protein
MKKRNSILLFVAITFLVTLICGFRLHHTHPESSKSRRTKYELSSLKIILPHKWHLDKSNKNIYNFMDEKGNYKGYIIKDKYNSNFDLLAQRPNHCSVMKDESIEIPLGTCRLLTLDTDNGTASSGVTGTHDVYFTSITIKNKAIFIISFTKEDKSPKTKIYFKKMLKTIKLID